MLLALLPLRHRLTRDGDDARRRAAKALVARLTGREHEVATAISEGLTNAEIARTVLMGVATVKTHVWGAARPER